MRYNLKISQMKRYSPFLFLLFLVSTFTMVSCLGGGNDQPKIDEEWKALNETRFNKVATDPAFSPLTSESGNGKVYWQKSDVITNTDKGITLKTTMDGRPEFTDTVVVRYEGWFFDKDGVKVIFDSTENPSLRSRLGYQYGLSPTPDPNRQKAIFAINPKTPTKNGGYSGIIEGFSVVLQDMQVGDERVVCIPQQLGYGGTASTYTPGNNAPTYTLIPAYTTLWFRIKLYEIIPMKGLKP